MANKPQSVTSLGVSPEQDRNSRMLRYTVAMVTRVACIILAFVLPYSWFTWLMWAGAIFLPYFAVVIANAAGSSASTKNLSKAVAPTLTISADAFTGAASKESGDGRGQ